MNKRGDTARAVKQAMHLKPMLEPKWLLHPIHLGPFFIQHGPYVGSQHGPMLEAPQSIFWEAQEAPHNPFQKEVS